MIDVLVSISNHLSHFPALYVREFSRSLSAAAWAMYGSILCLNLRFVSKNSLCFLRKPLKLTFISLCFRNWSPESFFHRNDSNGPLFGGAVFTEIVASSMTIRFLQSLCSGTCVRYAQGRPWLGVTLSLCTLLAHGLT